MPTTCLDLAMDVETLDDPKQHDRDNHALKTTAMAAVTIKMRRVLDMGLPGHRQRQHQRVKREDVEQRGEPRPGRACMKLTSTSPPASIWAMSKTRLCVGFPAYARLP